jgi:hypothetical protein
VVSAAGRSVCSHFIIPHSILRWMSQAREIMRKGCGGEYDSKELVAQAEKNKEAAAVALPPRAITQLTSFRFRLYGRQHIFTTAYK